MITITLKQNNLLKKILQSMERVLMQFEDIYPKEEKIIDYFISFYKGLKDVEDIKQNILANIARSCHTLKNPKALRHWLHSIVRNECFDRMRRKKVRINPINFSEIIDGKERFDPENMFVDYRDPLEILETKESRKRVSTIVKNMPTEWKEILIARYYKNLDYYEIAKECKINIGTVKSRLHRAKEQLREIFQKND